jgi:hypothetical protein
MKIDQTGSVRSTTARRSVDKTSKGGGGDFARELEQATGAEEAKASQAVARVDALIAAQEVSDEGGGGKARQRGEAMLDRLDEIRHGLLAGTLTRQRLTELNQLVQASRGETSDPRLAQVLDEIELRARVELAKFDRQA